MSKKAISKEQLMEFLGVDGVVIETPLIDFQLVVKSSDLISWFDSLPEVPEPDNTPIAYLSQDSFKSDLY